MCWFSTYLYTALWLYIQYNLLFTVKFSTPDDGKVKYQNERVIRRCPET